jgi:hypothetical protein
MEVGGGKRVAEEGKILKSGGKGIKLCNCRCGAKDSGGVNEELAEPEETLIGPDRRVLRDVFICGRHVWFGEE